MLTEAITDRLVGRNRSTVVTSAEGLVFRKVFSGERADADRRFRNTLHWEDVRRTRSLTFSPAMLSSDAEARTVVFPYLLEARSLQQVLDSAQETDEAERLFGRAGAILGELHSIAGLQPSLDAGGSEDEPLHGFDWLTPAAYARASGGELECWRLFQHDAELVEAVRTWTTGQRRFAMVPSHGDLRPDQFLVGADDEPVLIDWEEFTVAPAHRDVAGLLGAVLFDAIARAFTGVDSPESSALDFHNLLLDRGETMLDRARPVAAAILAGYRTRSDQELDRDEVARGIGWYVIERVIARSMLSYSMSASDRALAGIGRQAMLEPGSAALLLGEVTA
ncbi:phosphotransferase [Rathayibacter tanaceti]|uniref:Phosphotransferase n=2 Tax=Rathayibacter tanaceti TaxID=1671680 RepID=A0A166D7W7_9MICO|nr:phosphotransferase [Rathayibacter tanaceti]KZX22197.1 Phosphotransferase enzyme family protein [Rathayibacter tanaceti]QHC55088.1 phosphotransferase [Rathayibacter tanaceti]TCO33818.1 phosphotransferase family enzyme [Rathayibacter tanaceti]